MQVARQAKRRSSLAAGGLGVDRGTAGEDVDPSVRAKLGSKSAPNSAKKARVVVFK